MPINKEDNDSIPFSIAPELELKLELKEELQKVKQERESMGLNLQEKTLQLCNRMIEISLLEKELEQTKEMFNKYRRHIGGLLVDLTMLIG